MKERKSGRLVRMLCMTAMMAALVALSSKLQIQIPAVMGVKRFHLGNVMCALSGILLGPWWGALASGMGSMFFDLFDPIYIMEAPITFVTKGVYGLVAGLVFVYVFRRRSSYVSELVSATAAAASYIVLYLVKNYFYNGIFLHGLTADAAWLAMLEKVPSSVFNGAVAVAFAPVLGVAVQKALHAAHLDRLLE